MSHESRVVSLRQASGCRVGTLHPDAQKKLEAVGGRKGHSAQVRFLTPLGKHDKGQTRTSAAQE